MRRGSVMTRGEVDVGARLIVPSGVTHTNLDVRGVCQTENGGTTLRTIGGGASATTEGTGAWTNLEATEAGLIISKSTGTVSNAKGYGGTVDFTQSSAPRSVSAIDIRGDGKVFIDSDAITIPAPTATGPIQIAKKNV